MSRPDPIEYAERLYGAIRAANFSPMSFLAFGNAVKEGVAMRSMPRIAAEPFMRIVGEMLDLEEDAAQRDDIDAVAIDHPALAEPTGANAAVTVVDPQATMPQTPDAPLESAATTSAPSDRKRSAAKR